MTDWKMIDCSARVHQYSLTLRWLAWPS